jgi:hypothetical protein
LPVFLHTYRTSELLLILLDDNWTVNCTEGLGANNFERRSKLEPRDECPALHPFGGVKPIPPQRRFPDFWQKQSANPRSLNRYISTKKFKSRGNYLDSLTVRNIHRETSTAKVGMKV